MNNIVKTIAHMSDIHIRKAPNRNDEYEKVFENLYKSLTEKKPDRIVIVGDLVHDYLDLQGEQLILASSFLNRLSEIAPVRITDGNHDMRKKSIKRVNSVRAIVKSINNPNVVYYDKTGFYDDDNITWAVWKHGEPNNNPWNLKKKIYTLTNIVVDLFHDPIQGSKNNLGYEFKNKTLVSATQFKGRYGMFGDIHKMQYLNNAKTKAYPSSLVAQDFGEGDNDFHGYLLWDVINEKVEEIEIYNEYSFKNVTVNPFTDFSDLEVEVTNPTPHMKIRVIWRTLPATRTKENERKVVDYLKAKYIDSIVTHKNEFIEDDKIEIKENVTIEKIVDQSVQHEIFKNYLTKIGVSNEIIDEIIVLDDEISSRIDAEELTSIVWEIIKFNGTNFMSYKDIEIDWRDMDGLFQIYGLNAAGKTTIMKLLTYILYNKTLETEKVEKYGDKRYLNDKLPVKFCEGSAVIKANDQYYGIKRRTEITKNKANELTGAPTTLKYFLLQQPDDEFTDDNSLESLNEDLRKKTQKVIEKVIGSYDNFMRVVFTTSDTLNKILSNDMAEFIDSLLYDSGLDIFDLKLKELKVYEKEENNNKVRVSCNVDGSNNQITLLTDENIRTETQVNEIETVKIPDLNTKIKIGGEYVESCTKKLFKIDPDIYRLNVADVKKDIEDHNKEITDLNARKKVLEGFIEPLKKTYDEIRLAELITKKDAHKTIEYNEKIKIKGVEQLVREEEHAIELINGEIFNLKKDGVKYKTDIAELKESKTCPTCKQQLLPIHQQHIDEKVKALEIEMFDIAKQINTKETINKKAHQQKIDVWKKDIETSNQFIIDESLKMEAVLKEIGELTNDKNDVEKRVLFQNELDNIPTKIQNEELKITLLQQKIDNYDNSLLQIEENKKIEETISLAKEKLEFLNESIDNLKGEAFILRGKIDQNVINIGNIKKLISDFEKQEKRDNLLNLYKKCVHRDGIPKQMLVNYIIPKINDNLKISLANIPFSVWLDAEDLKLKFAYNSSMDSVINAISASGKERTFAALSLKSALNEINAKSKPNMFLLDELSGKLDDFSVEEFVEFLHLIKNRVKKVMIIEYKNEIEPDYVITVTKDENGISNIEIE
jgi:energy-coupling factor transporter ATP-binding protein EcfA2